MTQIIIHQDGKYNIFGTIAGAPYFTEGCTLKQLTNWIELEHGQSGVDQLPERLERAHLNGSSAFDEDLESTILCNRAGNDEACLTFGEFVTKFL